MIGGLIWVVFDMIVVLILLLRNLGVIMDEGRSYTLPSACCCHKERRPKGTSSPLFELSIHQSFFKVSFISNLFFVCLVLSVLVDPTT